MLPANYNVPTNSGNYMKFKDGSNRFYVLGKAIIGWQYWNTEGKPVRQKSKFNGTPPDIKINKDGQPDRVKHFWAFPVWNYEDKKLQVLEITQSGIQGSMKLKIDNRGGDVSKFDFIITRTGEGLGTDYDVDIDVHQAFPDEDLIKDRATYLDLEALYTGGDPFAKMSKGEDRISVVPEEINVDDIPF